MSFAKKMARKKLNKMRKDADAGARMQTNHQRDVLESFYRQNQSDTKIWHDTICDMMILFTYALYRTYNFKKRRIEKFYEKSVLVSQCIRSKHVTFEDLETILQDEAKYKYPHEELSGKKFSHDNKIRLKTIEEMSIIFYFAVYDLWGFCNKRLQKLSNCMAAEASCMSKGTLTIEDLENVLVKELDVTFDKDFSHLNESDISA